MHAGKYTGDAHEISHADYRFPTMRATSVKISWKRNPRSSSKTRYSVAPLDGSGHGISTESPAEPEFETRWAGKINDRLGAGFEIQFQESVEGKPGKNSSTMLFWNTICPITPQCGPGSSSNLLDLLSSNRAGYAKPPKGRFFSGYFFPGERDRGGHAFR